MLTDSHIRVFGDIKVKVSVEYDDYFVSWLDSEPQAIRDAINNDEIYPLMVLVIVYANHKGRYKEIGVGSLGGILVSYDDDDKHISKSVLEVTHEAIEDARDYIKNWSK
jgi:hypothetical protein